MSTEVQVTEPVSAEQSEQKDYQFFLNENLELLRKNEQLSKAVLKKMETIQQLEREAAAQNLQLAKSRAFSKGRRFVMALHVVLSILTGSSGMILWLKHLAPPEACWSILGGLVWFGAATVYIHALAEDER